MGSGGPRGLQIRRRRGFAGTGRFDSDTLPPSFCPSGESKEPMKQGPAPGQPEGTLVASNELSKTYRLGASAVPAVREVTLTIRRGEFVALQGPSGSGKTTLLNLFGLLDRPDAGTVSIEGQDGESLSENARSDMRRDCFGFVFQTFNLIPVLTAEENVAYPRVIARARRVILLRDGRVGEDLVS